MGNLWPYLNRISELLEDDERQAVLGDIQERGADTHALLDLTTLVLLRQLQAWKSWRTWLLAFALAIPTLAAIGGMQVITETASFYPWPDLTGWRRYYFLLTLLCRLSAAMGLAWATGFSITSLAKSKSASLVLPLLVLALWQQGGFNFSAVLTGIPALFGMAYGWSGRSLRLDAASILAAICIAFALVVPISRTPLEWFYAIAAFWPACRAVATSRRTRTVYN